MIKKKKRRQKAALKSNKIYFGRETENAIIAYNLSTDHDEREQLYKSNIMKPFDKLAENIINRFKFPYINNTFEDVKAQVVSFLVINIHKYTAGKGKAFSYFSVIAKNYLILHNNAGYKNEKKAVYLSDVTEANSGPIEEIMSVDSSGQEIQRDTHEFVQLMVEYWDRNLTRIFKKKRDQKIAESVVTLFRRAEGIENFNKKALYLMIREQTDYKTSAITKVINKMRSYVMAHLEEYKTTGVITDGSQFLSYK